ncbi:glycosyltransferase [Caminicella sporogenes]|uniref:glycosyltransferase n=1 Tax=Caminicella sporogenes TaxID=166485 RepID=UPI002541ED22|nr:glycosyltransferase [Caminicella sporogenes]WIF95778.1 glycosyltransferase [Caminicella sporogenes]
MIQFYLPIIVVLILLVIITFFTLKRKSNSFNNIKISKYSYKPKTSSNEEKKLTIKTVEYQIIKNKNKILPDASIIVPCRNEVNNLKNTINSLMSSKNSHKFEIIIVDDGSTDRSIEFLNDFKYDDIILIKTKNAGSAGSRNIGAKEARGRYLFFCDAHISVPNHWIDNLIETMIKHDASAVAPAILNMENDFIVGYGQTWNHTLEIRWLKENPEKITEIPIAPGCAFCITKKAFYSVGGFHPYFEVWGKEDEELSFKLWLFGHKIVVNPNVEVKHLFRKRHPYHVTTGNVIHNLLCIAYSHMEYKNLAKVINFAKKDPFFSSAMAKILLNKDLLDLRELFFKNRIYDENFFFEKFKIPFIY